MFNWIRKSVSALFFTLGLILFSSADATQLPLGDLLVRNVTLISPERPGPLHRASVLIRNGKIESVSDQSLPADDEMPILDGSGLFLVPGLMDSHLHTSVVPGLGFQGSRRARAFARMATLYERQLERSLLYFGITQVLDPAVHPAALARSRNRALTPDIFHCGAAPLANGYPAIFIDADAIAETLPYRIYENLENAGTAERVDLTQHTPEAVIARIRDDGAICVKLFFEDGWDNRSDWPMLSKHSIERVIRAARANGLKVVGHANAFDMQQLAVDAGVDVLGHGLWNWNQHRQSDGLPRAIKEHLDAVHAAGIAYQPTLRVMDSMQDLFVPEKLHDPALTKVVPSALINWYRTDSAQAFKQELAREDFDGLPEKKIAKLLDNPISRSERSLRYLAGIGHPLLLASDHPATPGHANHPGLSTYQELTHMAKLGIDLARIFEAATINNARTFGLEDRFGSVEAGKIANLLLLEANPLESIEAYDRIRWVILGGRAIARDTLSANYRGP